MVNVKQVADAADMIVNGYAFTRCAEGFRVLNLNRPDRAVVFSNDGKVLETSMDDIEVRIAGDYLEKNRIRYGTPNADTIEAIAEVEALKKDPHKKTYSSFAEIIAEANEEIGE